MCVCVCVCSPNLSPQIQGSGACRLISLRPTRVLACEMAELLSVQPGKSLAINKIVPTYKEMFGQDFAVSNYGFPKLIRALEAIPDTVDVSISCKLSYSWGRGVP